MTVLALSIRVTRRLEELDLVLVTVDVCGFELVIGLDQIHDAFDQAKDSADSAERTSPLSRLSAFAAIGFFMYARPSFLIWAHDIVCISITS